MKTDNSERIDRFLREQMSPEENAAFLRDLDADKSLREEAQLTAMMIQGLQEEQAQEDKAIAEEVVAARKKERQLRIIRMVRRGAAVAAMVVLLFSIYLYQRVYSANNHYLALAEKYYSEVPATTYRGDATDAEKELAELFHQVGSEDDMTRVADRLQTIYDNRNDEYAYKVNGNDVRIAWYLSLAYLKHKNPDRAKVLLLTIVNDDKGTGLRDQAAALLHELNQE